MIQLDEKVKNLRKLQHFNEAIIDSKRSAFGLRIRRFYTNTVGTILNKTSVPASLQVEWPVYLFCTMDKNGGYFQGNNLLSPVEGFYYFTDIFNNYLDFMSFTGVNNIKNEIEVGDVVQVYTDDRVSPTYLIWIVIQGQARAYGSILENPIRDGMRIDSIKFFSDSLLQYLQPLSIINLNKIGTLIQRDFIEPHVWKDAYQAEDSFINIRMNYNLNNYTGIYFYMLFGTDQITMMFNYKD